MSLIVLLIGFVIDKLVKLILLKIVKKIVSKTKNNVDNVFYEEKVFHRLSHIAFALVIFFFAKAFQGAEEIISKISLGYMVFIVVLVILSLLDVINNLYNSKDYSKNRPIKGLLQVGKIVAVLFGMVLVFAILTNSGSAFALLGGLSGMTAVTLLIFKDSILGLVAGIQLSANKLMAIGDWVEMPKYGADGAVVDISLTKIVIRNWDKTYTSVPAYRFLEDSFKNWKGMTEAGGRRMKRAIHINLNSIALLSEEDIQRLSKIRLLSEYFELKLNEIEAYNKGSDGIDDSKVNGRHLTNIGTFRAYIELYLKHHPDIHHENFTLIVRQLESTDKGVPVEVYCFINNLNWEQYEKIQSDIFDHLFAIMPEFGLKLYQSPSGDDLAEIIIRH